MPALVTGIHVFLVLQSNEDVDSRDEARTRSGHDDAACGYFTNRYVAV